MNCAHHLKTWPEFLDAVGYGQKTFEVRRNDRDFKAGDRLVLREWFADEQCFGPRHIFGAISYVLPGGQFGIAEGFCVFGLKLPANHVWPPPGFVTNPQSEICNPQFAP